MTCETNRFTLCQAGPSLRAIDKASVHKICSGQVIASVTSAVKELVENSLDAGSTSIEVRLREHGAESIEVLDNGCGVLEDNFQGLTLKHHTSKLKEFQDIVDLETFGFRGEALSSLCALSEVSIITFHRNAPSAFKLEFDHQGTLVGKTACSRQLGTTVIVRNLFSTLPVRRKEFLRNVKRDFAKMLNVLYAYCIGTTSVRISCSNQVGATRNSVLATQSGNSVTDNIACIFGQKQLSSLMEFRCRPPDPETLAEYSLEESAVDLEAFDVHGYVSSCEHGYGRGAPDRQFYFINRRPCDPARLSRLLNEVYQSFSRGRYPFVFMNITLKNNSVDVNVTPDKRQIFTDSEKILLAVVKSSLLSMYGSVTSAIGPAVSSPISSSLKNDERNSSSSSQSTPKSTALPSTLKHLKRTFSFVDSTKKFSSNISPSQKQPRLENFAFKCSPRDALPNVSANTCFEIGGVESDSDKAVAIVDDFEKTNDPIIEKVITPILKRSTPEKSILAVSETLQVGRRLSSINDCDSSAGLLRLTPQKLIADPRSLEINLVSNSGETAPPHSSINYTNTSKAVDSIKIVTDVTCEDFMQRRIVTVSFSFSELAARLRLKCAHPTASVNSARKFRAKISPSENSSAEEELSRQLEQTAFSKMEIIGQFNLGFIITRYESDLFIIDQHASDEKYNFENLQKSDVPRNQRLVIPLPLQLTTVHETILLDNINVFLRNGFHFLIGEEGDCGRGVSLVSVPVSKSWVFGKSDVDEMLFMLADSPVGTTCRPSRMRQMYASRACRKSVMIGTALKRSEMRKLVAHMGDMDKPWTCPHGRPTIRHLINLELVKLP